MTGRWRADLVEGLVDMGRLYHSRSLARRKSPRGTKARETLDVKAYKGIQKRVPLRLMPRAARAAAGGALGAATASRDG